MARTEPIQSRISAPEPTRAASASAGFVSRSLAMAIDLGVVISLIGAASLFAAAVELILPKWTWLAAAVPAFVAAVTSLIPLTYFAVAGAIAGRTAGKAVMGLRVVGLDGRRLPPARSVVRALAYLVSALPLFAGFLWVLVDGERRAWHDHIARSRVIYLPREKREVTRAVVD
jgi:uncharacterized RDD family membrane protein YckC